jgi:hypothetical protein
MQTVEVIGKINAQGELELEKLPYMRKGKVKITITPLEEEAASPVTEGEPDHISHSFDRSGWGARLIAKLESGEIDTSEWLAYDIEDPVEWLKELRGQERKDRGKDL